MKEKELLNKIKTSAESAEIPESLTPERITGKLHMQNTKTKKKSFLHLYPMQRAVSAAAVLLLCGTLSFISWKISPGNAAPDSIDRADTMQSSVIHPESTEKISSPEASETSEEPLPPKQDAGALYTVAKSYDDVYTHLTSALQEEVRYAEFEDLDSAAEKNSASMDLGTAETISHNFSGYSTTNLQTSGVDEGDCIKTDGRYIYTVNDSKVIITDAKDGNLTPAGYVSPDLEACDAILEIYVDRGKLLLIVSHCKAALTENCDKGYFVNTKYQTILYTYDITNPSKPILEGTVTQDGYYHTSRKIDDIVYLFTNKYFTEDTDIPRINEESIPYENIYLPKEGCQSLILSSINIHKPEQIVDKVMIIHNYVNIYVGLDSIYLYQTDYTTGEILTEIAGFSMDDGTLNAINAASVKGEILDTFAINESDRQLRILTTSYTSANEDSNNLYLFDKNMQLAGSLTGIAVGEQIYAARYFGNTAYFITYRNTDPLFAVDISDISHPKMLGELKISGFSEYLHFWENDKLLGIGYETDEFTGNTLGLKLVMFDISNPIELKVLDTLVLKDYIYSPALYNYKSILADASANLIGFTGEYQNNDYSSAFDYLLFSWIDNHFQKDMQEFINELKDADNLRGIYIGDIFYIANTDSIMSFNRKNHYTNIDSLSLK